MWTDDWPPFRTSLFLNSFHGSCHDAAYLWAEDSWSMLKERRPDGSAEGSHPAFRPHPIQGWTPDFLAKAWTAWTACDIPRPCQVAEDGVKELGFDEYVPIPSGGAIEMAMMLCTTQGIFTGAALTRLGCLGHFDHFGSSNFHDLYWFVNIFLTLHVVAGISGGASTWAAIEIAKKAPEGSAARHTLARWNLSWQHGWSSSSSQTLSHSVNSTQNVWNSFIPLT